MVERVSVHSGTTMDKNHKPKDYSVKLLTKQHVRN